MRSEAFQRYVLAIADRLVDVGDLHPDDAVELMDLYRNDIVRWEQAHVPPARAAKTLLARLPALMAIPTSNPLSSGVRVALGVTAALSIGTALVLLWKQSTTPGPLGTPSFTPPPSVSV
jgi:hypothetical protein